MNNHFLVLFVFIALGRTDPCQQARNLGQALKSMNRKPPKVLTSFVIVSILMSWNGISPCFQSGAGIQLSTVVWGNPVLLADEPAEQVEASAETAKQIVKRSMDLVFIIITSPVWIR